MDLSNDSAIKTLAEEIISLKYAMVNLSSKFGILFHSEAAEIADPPINCKGAIEDIFSKSNVDCDDLTIVTVYLMNLNQQLVFPPSLNQ